MYGIFKLFHPYQRVSAKGVTDPFMQNMILSTHTVYKLPQQSSDTVHKLHCDIVINVTLFPNFWILNVMLGVGIHVKTNFLRPIFVEVL